jgi:U3 small nucleolar RNA-associated protein MPP10
VKAATGFSAPDKQDGIRQQATALFKELCAKLDALSSFSYTPKPVVTELEVRGGACSGA